MATSKAAKNEDEFITPDLDVPEVAEAAPVVDHDELNKAAHDLSVARNEAEKTITVDGISTDRDPEETTTNAMAGTTASKLEETIARLGTFKPEDLVYAARDLCPCGKGLAYAFGKTPIQWDCSALLTGTAKSADNILSTNHVEPFGVKTQYIEPETFTGATTRPKTLEQIEAEKAPVDSEETFDLEFKK